MEGDSITNPKDDIDIQTLHDGDTCQCRHLLERKQQEWDQERKDLEDHFNFKKARFKELCLQKEETLEQQELRLKQLQEEKAEIQIRLTAELEQTQSVLALVEKQHGQELESLRRRYDEDIASLQHILQESIKEELSFTYQHDQRSTNDQVDASPQHHNETKEGGSLSRFRNKLISPQPPMKESLEESMKKAQQDTEVLKAVVLPLEEEIAHLKSLVNHSELQRKRYEAVLSELAGSVEALRDQLELTPEQVAHHLEEKLGSLTQGLQAEKASRSDLEMYVSVLKTQNTVLQDDAARLGTELKEVCDMLDQERRMHANLKRTWQMANDRFLEDQRLQFRDLQRMQSVLTAEQQRQIAELKRVEEQRSLQESASVNTSTSSMLNITSGEEIKAKRSCPPAAPESGELRRSRSSCTLAAEDRRLRPRATEDTQSLVAAEELATVRSTPLTSDQLRALNDLTPEMESRRTLVEHARQGGEPADSLASPGQRVVSSHEWHLLEEELRRAREKLGQPCEMCADYEVRLQQAQAEAQEKQSQLQELQESLDWAKEHHASQESQFLEIAQNTNKELNQLKEAMVSKEDVLTELRDSYSALLNQSNQDLQLLREQGAELTRQVSKLMEENEALLGKHIANAQQMQNEFIDLPNTLEDVQFVCLRLREDLIACQTAREELDRKLRAEIHFYRSCVQAEQHAKATVEDELTQELESLRARLGELESAEQERAKEATLRVQLEQKVQALESELAQCRMERSTEQAILTAHLEEVSSIKARLEEELAGQKSKIQSLQSDLDNSESVQRDFVKLSQSLQMQLETLRQSDTEVRWQHEDDIPSCQKCRKTFNVKKEKQRCSHCGKVLCSECNCKVFPSGPKHRPYKVCAICHTLLDNKSAPYFSSQAPS